MGQLITVWGSALHCTAVKESVGKSCGMQYTLVQFGTVQCTMYLPLHSFRLKLFSATIDLKHNAPNDTVGADEASMGKLIAVWGSSVQWSTVKHSVGQFSTTQFPLI